MNRLLIAVMVSLLAQSSIAGEERFVATDPALFTALGELVTSWKEKEKKRDDFRHNYVKLEGVLDGKHGLGVESGFDYEKRTGILNILMYPGIPGMFRYQIENGKVVTVDLVEKDGDKVITTRVFGGASNGSKAVNDLRLRQLEYCSMVKKGEKLKGVIEAPLNDKSQSVEKVVRTVVDDWGGMEKALSKEKIKDFQIALHTRLSSLGLKNALENVKPEDLIETFEHKFYKEGTWAWQKDGEATETYFKLKLPGMRQEYVFNGKNIGIASLGYERNEKMNYPEHKGFKRFFYSEDQACGEKQLRTAVASIKGSCPRCTPTASSSSGTSQ